MIRWHWAEMTNRIFVDNLTSPVIQIEGSEAHHLMNVLRLSVGDSCELFDGRGCSATGTITQATRRCAVITISDDRRVEGPVAAALTVAVCPPKGDRLKWMTEKLTELGVARLLLLRTRRTIVSPGDTKLEKLRSTVIAACKQSRRNHLMELGALSPLDVILQEAMDSSHRILIAHPIPQNDPELGPWALNHTQQPVLLLIGPEGGFTDEEVGKVTRAGGSRIAWPNTILRVETAAVAMAAVVISRMQTSGTLAAADLPETAPPRT